MNLNSKLSIRELGITEEDTRQLASQHPGGAPIARFYGYLEGVGRSRPGANGEPSIQFKGKFEGTNILTGELFRSTVLYLPETVAPFLEEEFTKGAAGQKDFSMKIAFDITVMPSNNTVKYKYGIKSLLQEKVNPFAELRSEIGELPSLPTPVKGKKAKAEPVAA